MIDCAGLWHAIIPAIADTDSLDETLPMTATLRHFAAISIVLLIALVLGAADACADGTLRIGRDQESTTFDPILVSQNADAWVILNANAMLVRANFDGTAVEPDLAERWSLSPDGLTYIFTLRGGLRFSDGRPLEASDVKFSLERVRDEPDSVFGAFYAPIASIATPDDRTIVITLSRPTAPFLASLALYAAAILPQESVEKHYDAWLERPVGAGAFKIVEWRRGQSITLDRNPYYWESPARPKLDQVQWIYIPNDETRVVKLMAGEIDAMIALPHDRIGRLRSDPALEMNLGRSSRLYQLLINRHRSPLSQRKVRQALCMAIDPGAIVKGMTMGEAAGNGPDIRADSPFYLGPARCAYDPSKAGATLRAAGVKDPTLLITSGEPVEEQLALLLQRQLARAGITLNIERQEAGQAWASVTAGEYDLGIDYWSDDIVDPDPNVAFHRRYADSEMSGLVESGRTERDPDKRKIVYDEIDAFLRKDMSWIDLYASPSLTAAQTYVKNFRQSRLGRFTLEDAEIAK
jgi:peptide/nickel transport system substrate-binding protein